MSFLPFVAPVAHAQTEAHTSSRPVRLAEISRREVFLPLYGALGRGLFRGQGLDVESKVTLGPDQTLAALLTGEADIALGGPDSAILSADASRADVKVIAAISRFEGSFLVSRQKIATDRFRWDMLKGKTVMGWRSASLPGVFFEAALRKAQIDPRTDIQYRTDVPMPARPRIWRGGRFDFGAFSLSEAAEFEREASGYPVVSIGQAAGPSVFAVFLTTSDFIRAHPDVAQKWANAIQAALSWTATAPVEELAATAAAYLPKVERADLSAAISRYRTLDMWQRDPTVSHQAIATVQEMMIAGGVMAPDKRVAYETVVEPRFAEAAKRAAPR